MTLNEPPELCRWSGGVRLDFYVLDHAHGSVCLVVFLKSRQFEQSDLTPLSSRRSELEALMRDVQERPSLQVDPHFHACSVH